MLLYVKGVKRELCDQIRTISDRKPRAQARQTLNYGQSDFFYSRTPKEPSQSKLYVDQKVQSNSEEH